MRLRPKRGCTSFRGNDALGVLLPTPCPTLSPCLTPTFAG